MIPLNAQHLAREVSRAVEFRRKHTARLKDIVHMQVGSYYRSDQDGAVQPENDIFAYKAFMLPELCYTPRRGWPPNGPACTRRWPTASRRP